MWTFPLISIFLSFILWKEKVPKGLLMILGLGLSMQVFSFGPVLSFSAEQGTLFSIFGKGLLVGLLYFHFGYNIGKKAPIKAEKMKIKAMLLVAMAFLTVANLEGHRLADGAAAISLILFPALFFRTIKTTGLFNIFGFFVIGVTAFFAFIFRWSKMVQDPFNLTPLVWMVCFAMAFYLVGNLKEIE